MTTLSRNKRITQEEKNVMWKIAVRIMYASYNINLQPKYLGLHVSVLERENRLFWRWGLKEVEPFIIFTFILLTLFLLCFIHILGYIGVVHVLRFMHLHSLTVLTFHSVCRRNKCLIINYIYNWLHLYILQRRFWSVPTGPYVCRSYQWRIVKCEIQKLIYT